MAGTKRKYSMVPYKSKRRRIMRRGRASARRSYLPRGLALRGVHHFKRTFQGSTYQASAGGTNPNAFYVTFANLPNYTEFTALFDMYRINYIVWKLVPTVTSLDLNPAATAAVLPNVHSVIDYDDSNNPTLVTDLMQYSNYKMTRGNRIHTRKFRPAVTLDADGAASTAPKWKQWLNLAATGSEHRGIKFIIEQADGVTSGQLPYKSYCTVYFSCKGVR